MLRRALLGASGLRASRLLQLQSGLAVQPAWASAPVLLDRNAARVRAFAAPPAAAAPVPQSKMADSHLNGASAAYLEELESRFRENPASVDKTWANFFSLIDAGKTPEALSEAYSAFSKGTMPAMSGVHAAPGQQLVTQEAIQKSMRILLLVRAYQVNGHYLANLDPLGIDHRPPPIELDPALYGFTEADLDKEFFIGTWHMRGFLSEDRPIQTLRQILQRLKQAYCGSIGYEYMHISDRDRCNWFRERLETPLPRAYSKRRKLIILDRLAWADSFENFLSNKYSAAKRFGLEGAETLIPGMKELIDRAADGGVESIVLGMPHRGRLNVLANVVRKPLSHIFSEFSSGVRPAKSNPEETFTGTGDVKYHLGTSFDRPTLGGKRIHLSLMANPSHLEAVNTVVQGKVRAKQYYTEDKERSRIMPILLHGDGAFAGQGVVTEALDMNQLPDYTVGGTIHIVVNNQVAFTTDPKFSRSSAYCTDVAKGLGIPVFHVNGDDVEAVVSACELAVEWRQRWKSDVVVDIVCYRRYGHNEIDDPMFTQPLMYKVIKQHRSAYQQYADKLVREGTVTPQEVSEIHDRVIGILNKEFDASKSFETGKKDWLASMWKGFKSPDQLSRIKHTGVALDTLKEVGTLITQLPEDFTPHRAIARVYQARRDAITSGQGVDWALAEQLAFATLMREGNHVRLSGQDVERGTFSHRHAILHDQANGKRYKPLSRVVPDKPDLFTVSNSSLSEFGVLGFELGYSLESPNQLVLWEAQFGDFANGAQVMFDQFISAGESKWLRQTGLTVLLPHGYDGQGPEHSSARLERFLQMSDEDPFTIPNMDEAKRTQIQQTNWVVCNVTTPANYFHLLRRQVHRDFRKPLVIMSPKALLRHPKCKSNLDEFDDVVDKDGAGTRFKRLIKDKNAMELEDVPPPKPEYKSLILCSGKVYYDLDAEREALGLEKEVAIVRVEQLAPLPWDLVMRELRRYPNAEITWCQEEPKNMGAYLHMLPRLQTALKAVGRAHEIDDIRFAGRPCSAAPSTGFGSHHAVEQAELLKAAFGNVAAAK